MVELARPYAEYEGVPLGAVGGHCGVRGGGAVDADGVLVLAAEGDLDRGVGAARFVLECGEEGAEGGGVAVSIAPVGSLDSVMWMVSGAVATWMQELPSGQYDDFCQVSLGIEGSFTGP